MHTIYNHPRTELSPTDSRVAMLRTEKPKGKDKKRKYRSTKDIPPDGRSLEMKIRRANLVTYDWKHCFNQYHNPFLPTQCGWELKDNTLLPKWYEGSNLPTDDEYDRHIKQKFNLHENRDIDDSNPPETSDSDNDTDSEEYALSESYSSSESDENDDKF